MQQSSKQGASKINPLNVLQHDTNERKIKTQVFVCVRERRIYTRTHIQRERGNHFWRQDSLRCRAWLFLSITHIYYWFITISTTQPYLEECSILQLRMMNLIPFVQLQLNIKYYIGKPIQLDHPETLFCPSFYFWLFVLYYI